MSELTAHHVGLTVTDLDRAVTFYTERLGLDVISRFSVGGEAFATGVGVDDARASFVHLDAGNTRLELVSYDSTESSDDRPQIDRDGAMHIGLTVDDVAAFYEALPSDVETVSEPQTTESGTTILFIRDPEGNLVEVLSK
ncbi:VOC family protein [Halobellus captivus]|uniref:VOC family protein n=1 Tax=Halobellus captivus TaxID=2592614 RepID=UPI0011A9583E|nr:VOC family protein [Halobellus captivus]